MLLAAVVEALNTYPELSTLHYEQMTDFIGLVRHLKPTLSRLETPYTGTPPASLSVNIQDFLAVSLGVEDNVLKHMWAAFRHTAWEDGLSPDGLTAHKEHTKYLPYFLKHGLSRNIAFYMLYPPLLVCVECMRHHRSSKNTSLRYTLGEEVSHPITVFTAHLGIVPGIATSAYCRKCNTRYYPNYYVHTQATHYYMAVDVCEFFTSMMANSWTSATNCARIYNESLADLSVQADLPASWHNRLRMEIEDVWMGFYLHGANVYALLFKHAINV
ncbi:hypothetical protein EW026_g4705 [Hermanssonia centrifuga]|uniref:CxC5 like cysteine cluster associated with KDZ domain-containing protein n=1 Tax=Hermanssonia centrifuga TaxID=98765 RepID=A0A4S4KGK5_9APHY|nr:hypothetical protein EW026_g4705 [Hermanssonia centrifuga]